MNNRRKHKRHAWLNAGQRRKIMQRLQMNAIFKNVHRTLYGECFENDTREFLVENKTEFVNILAKTEKISINK